MTADAYLPVWVYELPASFAFQPGGMLRTHIRAMVDMGVVKIIAGATHMHVMIDIKRPYYRPVEKQGPVEMMQ